MRWMIAAIACTGCSSILGIDDFKLSDGGPGDGGQDAPPIDAPANCLGAGRFIVCLDPVPASDLVINTAAQGAVNTDTDSRCLAQQPQGWTTTQGQPAACFLTGRNMMVLAQITATGSRPLVLAVDDSITIRGGIDAAAHQSPSQRPPGSPSSACAAPTVAEDALTASEGAGGGAGGSFVTAGGRGGSTLARMGGMPGAVAATPAVLRAGCNGGVGGRIPGTANAQSGNGGGAVYIVARNTIDIGGPINVSGAGGAGSPGGGGGAGSGGMIVLYAAQITDTTGAGTLVANGGGGAGGGDGSTIGGPGSDPDPSMPMVVPAGGGGATLGGPGFPAPNRDGLNANANRSGGGGGGAGGYIRANRTITIPASPSVSVVP